MIKAVLFDYFGVLYPDTFWALANTYLPERSEETQQQLHDLIKQADTGVIDQKEFWGSAAELFAIPLEKLEQDIEQFGGVDKGLIAIVKRLRDRGMKTGIISNVGHDVVRHALGEDATLFDTYILSADTGYIKPDPQVYHLALDELELEPEECVFIDDIPRNVRGAEAVGMKAIHYHSFPQFKSELNQLLTEPI